MHRVLQRSVILMIAVLAAHRPDLPAESLIQVDRRSLVSRADLIFDSPVLRPEEGMPLGNGRMGSLVWTTQGRRPPR